MNSQIKATARCSKRKKLAIKSDTIVSWAVLNDIEFHIKDNFFGPVLVIRWVENGMVKTVEFRLFNTTDTSYFSDGFGYLAETFRIAADYKNWKNPQVEFDE